MRSLVCLALLIVGIGRLSAAELDGVWWNSLAPVNRAFFVLGVMEARSAARTLVPGSICLGDKVQGNDLPSCIQARIGMVDESLYPGLARASGKQVMEGLNAFYSDYRNRQIGVSAAIRLVGLGIAGESEASIAAQVEALRRHMATAQPR